MSRPPSPSSELKRPIPKAPSRLLPALPSTWAPHGIESALDVVTEPLAGSHSSVHHVEYLPGAMALNQAGGHGAALPRGANRRHRTLRVDPLRHLVDVVVGHVHGPREVPGVPFAPLA